MKESILLARIRRIRSLMKKNGWDGWYVTSPENHRYVCGFANPDGQVLVTEREVLVYADARYYEAARREIPDSFRVILPKTGTVEELKESLEGRRTVAFEDASLSCRELARLKKELPWVEWAPSGDALVMFRSVKTREEVDSIVRAQRIAEDALSHLLKHITYNMTEIEVAAELEYYMKKHGSEDKSFDTIAVSGTNSSSPHGVPRPVKLEKGFLTMDFGAVVDGYHSDMTRTIVIGKADAEIRKLYDTVLRAQISAIEAMHAGAKNADMDRVARDIIEQAGYTGKFCHSLGHGVGLEIHEKPNLSPRSGETVLHAGEIVTAEPGIYLENRYGCRIEDMIWIRKNGCENLTRAPKELVEI